MVHVYIHHQDNSELKEVVNFHTLLKISSLDSVLQNSSILIEKMVGHLRCTSNNLQDCSGFFSPLVVSVQCEKLK